jgi:hypothetical protein
MDDKHHISLLIILLVIFAVIFFLAFIGLQIKQAFFNIGLPYEFENWLIMILCIGSIAKIVWELYKR